MGPSLVVFDMDGTLADTSPGIIGSYMAVADSLGVPRPSIEKLYENMGGPLIDNLSRVYNIDREMAVIGAQVFRNYYEAEGYKQAKLYPGMEEVLRELRSRSVALGIATMKLDEYAKQLVQIWGVGDLFLDVCGADALGVLTKSDLIDRCIYAAGADPSGTVMIGDSVNDLQGAEESGVRFIAVTYGYGFDEVTCVNNSIEYAGSPADLLDLL